MTTSSAVVNFNRLFKTGSLLRFDIGRLPGEHDPAALQPKEIGVATIGELTDGEGYPALFHAVVSLYDRCLPDTSTEDIYEAVAYADTKTLLFYVDRETAIKECKTAYQSTKAEASENGLDRERESKGATAAKDEKKEEDSVLRCVYSDESESESEDEDEEDKDAIPEEWTQKGQSEFLAKVKERRRLRKSGMWSDSSVSVESRIAGAVTIRELDDPTTLQPVMQILLVAVRPRFQHRGLGRKLMQTVLDWTMSRPNSVVITYADNSAEDFFKLFGLTDDLTLGSKYKDLVEPWVNSTFMCLVPGYEHRGRCHECDSTQHLVCPSLVVALDHDIEKCQASNLRAQQDQAELLEKMKRHLKELQAKVSSQQSEIEELKETVKSLRLNGTGATGTGIGNGLTKQGVEGKPA